MTFSGLAVIVSLAGLWMVDNQALRSMALGAMTVVAVSILTATTLLPALIAMLGDRVMPGGDRRQGPLRFFKRRVFRRPERPGRGGPGFLGALDHAGHGPSLARGDRRLRGPAHAGDPAALDRDRHRGARPVPQGQRRAGRQRTRLEADRRRRRPGADRRRLRRRHAATAPRSPPSSASSRRRRASARSRRPPSPPTASCSRRRRARRSESDAAIALVDRLRDSVVPRSALSRVATVDVGGETARSQDARVQISGSMWKIVLFVLALSFLVLMVMLRSLLLPLKAVLMNLLSIGAAFGVLVAIFQWGWFDSLLGFESQGALDTINVPLIFAIVFGLSMDYEVFLMSRIRERYMVHGDNERAVAEGLSSSARTISSAALIMTCVFAVFVLTGVPSIKELGLGCAVAIALDATLVRLILVPAAMKLLGGWNWWMPSWLDRALPDLSFEDRSPSRARRGLTAPSGPDGCIGSASWRAGADAG